MNLSDTFYIALCMTVLILGVVYWFWTQNQYIQRKMNLLENIVYEMKTSLQGNPPAGMSSLSSLLPDSVHYQPAPSSVLGDDEDLEHETLLGEVEASGASASASGSASGSGSGSGPEDTAPLSGTVPEHTGKPVAGDAENVPEALRPGAPTLNVEAEDAGKGSMLENMTLKELRRLADQKGISGSATMRKPALIEAIRAKPASVSPFSIDEGVLDLNI